MRIESNVLRLPKLRTFLPLEDVALSVDLDEPVSFIQEEYALTPDYREFHRWLILGVVRGDRRAGFWLDLGPETDFQRVIEGHTYRQPAYIQPVAFEHRVGECLAMAEQGRHEEYAVRHLHEQVMSSDLRERYYRLLAEDMDLVRNRSVIGPYHRTERHDFSRTAAAEFADQNAARDERHRKQIEKVLLGY